ncbi:MAG: UDP-N-acetylmuramate dehydrogenase [bacterium]|nr:UDP-N-acetylmuramate dehydrogenase [Coriobacteriales bacterium]MCR5845308.1 UDP-N-acetylmuramate dehydrogenase [bacterium]
MSSFDAYIALRRGGAGRVLAHERMARHTTFRIGGEATAFVECDTFEQLTAAITICEEQESDWTIVGKGSNLLISDRGYDGIILTLGKEFKQTSRTTPETVTCGAGASLAMLVQEAFNIGLSGFEFAVGIPGSLGGAIFMNAGTKEATIGQVVKSVVVYKPGAGLRRYYGADLPWIYRYSGIPADEVILEAEIAVKEEPKPYIQAKMEGSLNRRRKSQPINLPSAGSIFRNPVGASAGRLIEDAGFKGYKIGGAVVSEKHANFIVNEGGATAADVLMLMRAIRKRVKEIYGIELQPEIKLLGF